MIPDRIYVQGNHEKSYFEEIRKTPIEPREASEAHYCEHQAHGWIAKHEEDYQPALKSLISKIQRISYNEFRAELGKSIKHAIGQFDVTDKDSLASFLKRAVVLVEDRKSNQWVAELARKYWGFNAADYYRLGEKDARSFTDHIRSYATPEEKERLKDKVIVLFDDGSYSGTQLHDHVMALMELKQKKELNFDKVCVIVPYMTDHAKEKLARAVEKIGRCASIRFDEKRMESPKTKEMKLKEEDDGFKIERGEETEDEELPDVVIAKSKKIYTVAESISEEHAKLLTKLWWSKEKPTEGPHSKGVIWFDHKIPNDQSFIGAIEKGNVINSKTICKTKFKILPDVVIPYK